MAKRLTPHRERQRRGGSQGVGHVTVGHRLLHQRPEGLPVQAGTDIHPDALEARTGILAPDCHHQIGKVNVALAGGVRDSHREAGGQRPQQKLGGGRTGVLAPVGDRLVGHHLVATHGGAAAVTALPDAQ